MKNIFLLFFSILLIHISLAQTAIDFYNKGDSLYRGKDYKNAALAYISGIRLDGSSAPIDRLWSSAEAWAMCNFPDSAFTYLNKIALSKNLSLNYFALILTDPDLVPLHNDKRWQKIYRNAESSLSTPQDSTYTQQEIIYGRKDGMALTMLHLKPISNANGKAIVQVISGGWRSSLIYRDYASSQKVLNRGYSVFVVPHGSTPVYTILDAVTDLQRAIRFIRFHAGDYGIDPEKIGVTGASAGGHLSLICGLMDQSMNEKNGDPDPLDFISAKVQAVACYFPPTDFLNWGVAGKNIMNSDLIKQDNRFDHLFEFRKWDAQTRQFKYITDTIELNKILFEISPINNVSSNDAAVLIIHGDKDNTVPIQQSESLIKKLESANVPVSLNIRKGGGHGDWIDENEIKMILDWFDKYLK